ncbi:hypothetical protein [Aquimarina macrocephali]|uniref:hypothetical protein n=1 Tax=Aquimarina macrocephali TaxID=666563 RepID=UPI00046504A7|nr:hypothetical protein [Aquimarina macrocephali]
MKIELLSIFDGLFSVNTKEKKPEKSTAKIFITDTHTNSGRTLMIEEETYAVWAYLLSTDKEDIDFDGFLCAVIDPKFSGVNSHKNILERRDAPLPALYANRYSYVKNLKKKDIKIHWQEEHVTIFIKKKVYLIMDLNTKTSYSKGLADDCDYGKQLKS